MQAHKMTELLSYLNDFYQIAYLKMLSNKSKVKNESKSK